MIIYIVIIVSFTIVLIGILNGIKQDIDEKKNLYLISKTFLDNNWDGDKYRWTKPHIILLITKIENDTITYNVITPLGRLIDEKIHIKDIKSLHNYINNRFKNIII